MVSHSYKPSTPKPSAVPRSVLDQGYPKYPPKSFFSTPDHEVHQVGVLGGNKKSFRKMGHPMKLYFFGESKWHHFCLVEWNLLSWMYHSNAWKRELNSLSKANFPLHVHEIIPHLKKNALNNLQTQRLPKMALPPSLVGRLVVLQLVTGHNKFICHQWRRHRHCWHLHWRLVPSTCAWWKSHPS